jgi:hypothetical protein
VVKCIGRAALGIGLTTLVAAIETPLTVSAATQVESTAGWKKYDGNPVMGGKYGTCFDISVLKDGDTYRMWLSWRPKQSIALVESPDGIHWSEPPLIVLAPKKETGWEGDINRPVVIKKPDGYHMWYTGQATNHSWIGYATSPDGHARTCFGMKTRSNIACGTPAEANTNPTRLDMPPAGTD